MYSSVYSSVYVIFNGKNLEVSALVIFMLA